MHNKTQSAGVSQNHHLDKKGEHHPMIHLFLFIVFVVVFALAINADSIDMLYGRSYYVDLDTRSLSGRWAGIKVVNNGFPLAEGPTPFTQVRMDSPEVLEEAFSGYNLNDGVHYYAIMHPGTFSASNLVDVEDSDLEDTGLFNIANYPVFYPNYYQNNDNPNKTFCCNKTDVMIGGVNFTAFHTNLADSIDYYLLKYNDGGTDYPLFLSPITDSTCYNSTSCVGEFMLPISPTDYNVYSLSKYPIYNYRVWVDGSETLIIPQTALPYNITVEAINAYTSLPAPDVPVLIGENDGQNLFIPYRLSGYISEAYTVGLTDANGMEYFLVTPTVYPTIQNYSIYVAVMQNNYLTSRQDLSVTSKDTVVQQSKPLTPTTLYDNAKANVNSMSQMADALYKWSSELEQAKTFTATYYINTNSWSIVDTVGGTGTLEFKTGAPNVVTVVVRNGITILNDYTLKIKEEDGYLIMNPYTKDTPLDPKERYHQQNLPTQTQFILSPTSLGAIQSNITLELYDPSGNFVDEYTAFIDDDLNIGSGGAGYNNDLLKAVVNSISVVLNSLFYSLNN